MSVKIDGNQLIFMTNVWLFIIYYILFSNFSVSTIMTVTVFES
jgi:hypothetical protein